MNPVDSITTALPPTCTITIPKSNSDLHSIISRWSDLGVNLPFAVVVPSTPSDIIAVIKFGLQHNLRIIPSGGGHGVFVPIDDRTIYLDMRTFNTVTVDKTAASVTVGGGAITGDVMAACVEEGCYTLTSNSNAPGFVGVFLGGGNSFCTGLHGMAVDHVLSLTIVTATSPSSSNPEPQILILNPSSTGAQASLLAALRGAGHGLGIITSLTLRTFPISSLNMPNNLIWNRKLVFPASAISTVAALYTSLLPPTPAFLPVLLFARSPPGSPAPGTPMLILSANYYGPSASAERCAAPLLSPEIEKVAMVATTTAVPFANLNDASAAVNAHGGNKQMFMALLRTISAPSITSAFEKFVAFGDENPDAKAGTYAVLGSWDTAAELAGAGTEKTSFEHRDRGVFFQFTPWYTEKGTTGKAAEAAREIIEVVRESDMGKGVEGKAFANNLVFGQDVGEVYGAEVLERVKAVKAQWDPKCVFWSPVGDERLALRDGKGNYL